MIVAEKALHCDDMIVTQKLLDIDWDYYNPEIIGL